MTQVPAKHLAFDPAEYAARQSRAQEAMAALGQDALVLFAQESMFYLTGYDTTGYSKFQAMVLPQEGAPVLLTRSADLLQAEITSLVDDIRIWVDREGAQPAADLVALLRDLGLAGGHLGIELSAWTLTGARWEALRAALEGVASWQDASALMSGLRLVKSPAEIAYVREAATYADLALDAAYEAIGPQVDENQVLAAMTARQLQAGSDLSASRWILGSGPLALMCRSFSGYRKISNPDQVTLEWAGVSRHYHVAMMRTLLVGKATPDQVAMHGAALDALLACQAECRPGRSFGDVFAAHAKSLDACGRSSQRLNACGYTLSAQYPPSWMGPEEPMFNANNPLEIKPGMTLFMHMIMFDSEKGLAMCPGETLLVTEEGHERLSRHSLDLVVL